MMGLFDGDPKFEELRRIREDEGYTGWLDQDNQKVACPCCGSSSCTAGLTERCNG
ncbi:MAG: hypothetical protein L0I24_09875 [Pseudonocardia sp.]|nr:hypothetical protein [Pseudonocardia sp.]